MPTATVEEIIADIKAGKMVIIVDDEDRENEGDLLMAAEFARAEDINFMIKHARGLVCLPLANEIVDRLQLPQMTQVNRSQYGTNFTVSIEAAEGITTGISAADRARTVQAAIAADAKPSDIATPGHIFPLRAAVGGVLMRAGHTEAGVDLTRMAGLIPAAVICEVMNDDGTMARLPQLKKFAEEHNIKISSIADLIAYRSRTESLVENMGEQVLHTEWGTFTQHIFVDRLTGETHLALVRGNINPEEITLVRVHEPFSALDFIHPSPRHSWSLPQVLRHLGQSDQAGVVILLHRNEDGAALLQRALPQKQTATTQWDSKSYGIGAQILVQLNVRKMRIMGGKPSSFKGMTGFGLEICDFLTPENDIH